MAAALTPKQKYLKAYYSANKAKGVCTNHPSVKAVPGTVRCAECLREDKQKKAANKKNGMCPRHPGRKPEPGRVNCKECREFNKNRRADLLAQGKCYRHPTSDLAPGRTMCAWCLEDMQRRNHDIHNPRYRARKKSVPHEPVDRKVVFQRDKWTCQHCHKHVNGDARADHVIPLSLGGPHTYWNHQTLCDGCNGAKGNNIHKEPRLAHLVHLPIEEMIKAFQSR